MSPIRSNYLIEYDSAEMDDSCSMRYWYRDFECGKGIRRKDQVVPNSILSKTHDDLRVISQMEDLRPQVIQSMIDDVLNGLSIKDKEDFPKMELLYRRLGWMAAFALYIEPAIRVEYHNVKVDEELLLDRGGIWIITKPDRILKRKLDETGNEEIVYQEYVTMPPGLGHVAWFHGFFYNMRMHAGMAAADEVMEGLTTTVGDKVSYGQVRGLSLGFRSSSDGRLCHPYVWGYYNKDKAEWTPSVKSSSGGRPTPVWEYPLGIVNWVQLCGKAAADGQFPLSPPIYLNETALQDWLSFRLHREREISSLGKVCHDNKYLRMIHFPKKTTQCRPTIGETCPYLDVCWNDNVKTQPLQSGLFVQNRTNGRADITSNSENKS